MILLFINAKCRIAEMYVYIIPMHITRAHLTYFIFLYDLQHLVVQIQIFHKVALLIGRGTVPRLLVYLQMLDGKSYAEAVNGKGMLENALKVRIHIN